jgi:membrane protease subunit HflK
MQLPSAQPGPEDEADDGRPPGPGSRLKQRTRYVILLLDLKGWRLALLAALLGVAWVSSGIYKVQPDEQGVILRFGRLAETTGPGLHYHWPFPVEAVLLPKVTEVKQIQLGSARLRASDSQDDLHEGQMLTGDENIVEAECTVLWRIKDAGQFLFNVQDAPDAVRVTAESALREIIGRTPIQAAMSDKRQQIADKTMELLQQLLDKERSLLLAW